ncbi:MULTISPECIES: flagellar basal body rod C-terminal domain-containing protein [unclassified Oleiphilus]|uniref:flagellar basal body rod C-terminal domain-containing protein n=2 Tax=Oleiphilus TaxID=141450 RepID=UPI0007C34892|nr:MULTISPECIES: flagellar basal body rod C-terminal domain-containing protein [unclassified Oleiphilus]KZY46981.1 flagellar biosynthesis protein FlgE [Oleiphilus sp. HI0050]KZY76622.1 flagellar biosynthesis protein FlgE [Oleiphilus sp. HI0068]KZY83833.1 flagellar biosynthesis protein FlgE [Oleiphilus sp. HI0069]KZY86426.1 flagellar biosynthesis protein FlgE [Oleiphilus sp. HI0072]KZZ09922.1 flagellar biosynthesis protein FlgE [Oleiphilus sp. HI0078]KZZ23439.1 flagellar biosynthesis protein F
MNVNTVLQTGIQGLQQGQEGMQKAATEIVNASTVSNSEGSSSSVIEPIVDLKLYERSVEASAQVVKTADEVLGTLLDTLA